MRIGRGEVASSAFLSPVVYDSVPSDVKAKREVKYKGKRKAFSKKKSLRIEIS